MKKEEQLESVSLRKKGLSVNRIAKILGVSRSSVSCWVRDVKITELQKIQLSKNKGINALVASEACKVKCKNLRLKNEEIGRLESKFDVWDHAAGCMLWWAEGSKCRNSISITNCDFRLLKFFIYFLKKYYNIKDSDLSIRIQHHGNFSELELNEYWKKVLDIPDAHVTKSSLKEKKSSKTKWPYGICRISVHQTELVSRLWGSLQRYIDFDAPDGLKR